MLRVLAVSSGGRALAGGSRDGTVRLWNLDTAELTTVGTHKGGILSLAFSPDGKLLASAGEDGVIKVWDPRPATE